MAAILVELGSMLTALKNLAEVILRTGGDVADAGRTLMGLTAMNLADASSNAASSANVNVSVTATEIELLKEAAATAVAAIKITPILLEAVLTGGIPTGA